MAAKLSNKENAVLKERWGNYVLGKTKWFSSKEMWEKLRSHLPKKKK
jgi:hypothetical protein